MKNKVTKIWGVGLTLVLATTMLLFPMPASAGTLSWGSETIPSTSGYRLGASSDVVDIAVSAGGDVIYSANSSEHIYRSTNSGETWSQVTVRVGTGLVLPDVELVAVAQDDENYIAVAGNGTYVYISDDAGANWDSLGTITTLTGMTDIYDLAISVAKSGKHFVAVAGIDTPLAEVAYYEIGAVGAEWKDTTGAQGTYGTGWAVGAAARAVAFSPNFASDETMVALSGNGTGSGATSTIYFQIWSFDQKEWNASAGFTDYPENIQVDATEFTNFDAAAIALSPDYLGSDDSMRLAFVAITCDGTGDAGKNSGIQRLEDDDATTLKEKVHMNSIAYDGTNLVAGRYDSNTVYRSADPLASSPSVSGSAGLKSPGLNTTSVYEKVIVAWSGSDVVAGTSGDDSAFAVSENDGKTFNDISLIDTTLTVLSDLAVSADGSNIYLTTDDGNDMSLWRYASRWERVLTVDSKTAFLVRTAPDDMDAVYVGEIGDTSIYYSADAGQDKWHTRIATENIEDLAVETDGDVVYVASSSGYVSKSTNSGFTWATKKSSKLSAISMLTSLGEDLLLAGSDDGKAAYSKDGNTSWTKLADGMTSGTVQVVADGLDEGDLICAVVAETADDVYRWDWDEEEWEDIGDVTSTHAAYGIALQGGILYVVSSNGTYSDTGRSLNPTSDDPSFDTMTAGTGTTSTTTANFTAAPSALRVSVSDTTNKLWAIDRSSGDFDLFSYKDTLAVAAPTLLAPREGFENEINPISGTTFDITFSFVRPSKKVTAYDFQIALDSTFNEVALSQVLIDDSSTVGVVAGPTGSTLEGYTFEVAYMPDTTYYWRVRVDAVSDTTYGPIRSPWSDVRSFKIVEAPVTPAVTVGPTPEITVTIPPAPSVTLPAPVITIPTPEIVLPAPQITLPPTPAPVAPIPGWALYAIIFIGAVLVIALIVLILRTRRPV